MGLTLRSSVEKLRRNLQNKIRKSFAEKQKGGDINVYSSGGLDGKHDQPFYFDPSIIIGRKGSIGSLQYVDEPFWAIDTTYILDEPAENVKLVCLRILKAYRIKTSHNSHN